MATYSHTHQEIECDDLNAINDCNGEDTTKKAIPETALALISYKKPAEIEPEAGSYKEDIKLGIVHTIVAYICCNVNASVLSILITCLLNLSDVGSDLGLVFYLYNNEERTKIILHYLLTLS